MFVLELAAFSIVVLYGVSRTLAEPNPGHFLTRFGLLCMAGWMAEESCIDLYGFYQYSPSWSLFLGHVPLLIVLIWPAIIHSAQDLASQLLEGRDRHIPIVGAGIVFTDALFIEPVAVEAGLWSWNEPGIFGVPPAGIVGWGYFSFLCLCRIRGELRPGRLRYLMLPMIPVVGTHLLLLVTWWGALRWINVPLSPAITTGLAWAASLSLLLAISHRRTGLRLKRTTLLVRLPAALLFFALLGLRPSGSPWLWLYSLAFVPPYVSLMVQQYRTGQPKLRGH